MSVPVGPTVCLGLLLVNVQKAHGSHLSVVQPGKVERCHPVANGDAAAGRMGRVARRRRLIGERDASQVDVAALLDEQLGTAQYRRPRRCQWTVSR